LSKVGGCFVGSDPNGLYSKGSSEIPHVGLVAPGTCEVQGEREHLARVRASRLRDGRSQETARVDPASREDRDASPSFRGALDQSDDPRPQLVRQIVGRFASPFPDDWLFAYSATAPIARETQDLARGEARDRKKYSGRRIGVEETRCDRRQPIWIDV